MQSKKYESRNQQYLYQLLDRLRTDCEYYLGNGNHHPQALWAGDEEGQISKMREIWNKLDEKPDWLTWEDINDYADKMGVIELPSTRNNTAKKEIQDMLDRNYEKEKKVGLEESTENNLIEDLVYVYQIKEPGDCEYGFMPYEYAKDKLNLNDYKLNATVIVNDEYTDVNELLEYVFAFGNSDVSYYEDNPEARSISVSDILQYKGNNYYVDSFGFVLIGKDDKLIEATIHTNQTNNIDLEKEKEEVEQQLQDVEELQAKKKELDDKVDELFAENKEIKEESQVSNYTLEEIGQCLKDKGNDFKLQIIGADSKTKWLNIDKDDVQKIYNALSYKKKKTEDVKQDLGIESGSDEEAKLNELTDRNLKDEFNSLTKEEQQMYLDLVPENLGPVSVNLLNKIAEHDGLNKDILYWVVNIRGGKIEESKADRFVEFDVTVWHNDVNQRRILNILSDIIYDNAGELLDTSNMEIINFDKTKYTLQVKIDKNITEKQLDEKISDGIYDIGAEVDDISEYREIQPKTIMNEGKTKGFPSSEKTATKLAYSDIKEVYTDKEKFKNIFTNAQLKWLILNGFDVNELYAGLKEILSTFRNESFKDIISIDEYINELNN